MAISFYGIPNWNKIYSELKNQADDTSSLRSIILEQNKRKYIIIFEDFQISQFEKQWILYKKHATQIIKYIVIGKLPLNQFADFKNNIDKITNQSEIISNLLKKYPDIHRIYFQIF